ncbi:uncharacterized protein BDV14DRAFT_201350 [Aspergillus stella-maris]|uniref:uncharacterized protein n=1 Tax=Aspergillus stella-maris TaxID=1810926 RepID=UPI003CCD2930
MACRPKFFEQTSSFNESATKTKVTNPIDCSGMMSNVHERPRTKSTPMANEEAIKMLATAQPCLSHFKAMPEHKVMGKARPRARPYRQMSYTLSLPSSSTSTASTSTSPPPRPQSLKDTYTIYVAYRSVSKSLDARWAVILQNPIKYPGEGDCTWYHCIGTEWAETDKYRHQTAECMPLNHTFWNRKWRVGEMTESQVRNFERAFRMTYPQPNEFFLSRFLRHLVEQGVLRDEVVVHFERAIGPCPVLWKVDPKFKEAPPSPEGELLFAMEL